MFYCSIADVLPWLCCSRAEAFVRLNDHEFGFSTLLGQWFGVGAGGDCVGLGGNGIWVLVP